MVFLFEIKINIYICSTNKQKIVEIMTTTITIIEKELENTNIQFTGIYSGIPKMILNAVNDIKHFGVDAINKSTLGKGAKKIALELAEKDTRKAVLINGKTILK